LTQFGGFQVGRFNPGSLAFETLGAYSTGPTVNPAWGGDDGRVYGLLHDDVTFDSRSIIIFGSTNNEITTVDLGQDVFTPNLAYRTYSVERATGSIDAFGGFEPPWPPGGAYSADVQRWNCLPGVTPQDLGRTVGRDGPGGRNPTPKIAVSGGNTGVAWLQDGENGVEVRFVPINCP
jgi:hypothetical protein